MKSRLLPQSEYRIVPWKNGGGLTAEIAVFPPTASFAEEPFHWRLSSARVSVAGAFSRFAGYSRILTVRDGDSIRLRFVANGREALLLPGEVCRFSGDEEVRAELPGGPATDLGLIFDPTRVRVDFEILSVAHHGSVLRARASLTFLHALGGSFEVLRAGAAAIRLSMGDTLRLEGDVDLELRALDPSGCRVACAGIGPVPQEAP